MKRISTVFISITLIVTALLYMSYKAVPPTDETFQGEMTSRKNLIAIQLESFQAFVLEREVAGQEITPNLNRLIEESVYFPQFYLQNGAGNTTDAEFMFNTSLFPLRPWKTVYKDAAEYKFPSLPRMLKEQGYQTITLHTNNIMFFNRKDFYSALGFDRFLDRAFFGTKDYVAFGASDDELYAQALPVLKKYFNKKQKFYAHFVTMTNHYPFKLPAKFKQLQLPSEFQGTFAGDYLQSVHYADAALGRFLDTLKESGMYDSSLLAVYGDHTGIQMSMLKDADRAALKSLLGRDYNLADALNVPFVLHSEGLQPLRSMTTGGHVDMLPTVMSVLGLQVPAVQPFGYDLLRGEDHPVGVRGAYAEPGTFVRNGVLYDPKAESALDIRTGETKANQKALYDGMYRSVMQRFAESDARIARLPKRGDGFGRSLTLFDVTELYSAADLSKPLGRSLKPSTAQAFEEKPDGWYRIEYKGKPAWIHPERPMIEVWKNVKITKPIKLHKEPDESLPEVMTLNPTDIAVSKEWVGTGWYQFFTWAGDFWGKVE